VGDGQRVYTSVEICAGAGGQAVGLEGAGFEHAALVEIDAYACATLRLNRPKWNVIEADVRKFDPAEHLAGQRIDLLAGGVPCPPFSLAGKQLGRDDERDLFPAMLELVEAIGPSAVMIENVRGLLQPKFDSYRAEICHRLEELGYVPMEWRQFNASDFGVPQLRPRSLLVALKPQYAPHYLAPEPDPQHTKSVGQKLKASMKRRGMSTAEANTWAKKADAASPIAPTLVGGSKKHGGADLGPTRAKRQWELMGVDGHGLANDDEPATLTGPNGRGPRLTVTQAALLQGFPEKWAFSGGKTARYRQVGNAFPPPVAQAVATQIMAALRAGERGDEAPEQPVAELPAQRSAARTPRRARAPRTEAQPSLPQ
jgi:DNA (cytosine-5)-methyltransferase 1